METSIMENAAIVFLVHKVGQSMSEMVGFQD